MKHGDTVKMWVSKYALSKGIEEWSGKLVDTQNERWYFSCGGFFLKIGTDVHKTRELAVTAARKLQLKKIASLEKQLEKLRKLDFV